MLLPLTFFVLFESFLLEIFLESIASKTSDQDMEKDTNRLGTCKEGSELAMQGFDRVLTIFTVQVINVF